MKNTTNNLEQLIQKYQQEKNNIIIMDDYDAGRIEEMSHVIMELKRVLKKKNKNERCYK